MEPFLRETLSAQRQRDLRLEADARRLAARVRVSTGMRGNASRILFALAELLARSAEDAVRRTNCRDASRTRSLPYAPIGSGPAQTACPATRRPLRLVHSPPHAQRVTQVAHLLGAQAAGIPSCVRSRCPQQ
jgi:hypothetical protein